MNRLLPRYLDKLKVMVLGNKRLTMSNFLDRLTSVYKARTLVLLEEPTPYPFLRADELSYRDILEIVNRMADAFISMGIKRGDRVIAYTRNRLEMPLITFAA